jgi:hypothetical protein
MVQQFHGWCALQTILVLAWLWLKSAKLFASGSDKSTWHIQNQPHRAFSSL